MGHRKTAGLTLGGCHRDTSIFFAAVLWAVQICLASDAPHKWTVVVHKNGAEIASIPLAASSLLHDEIESTRKLCVEKSRMDLRTYAPSLMIESELERIDLGEKRVVYLSRKTIESTWNQRSRPSEKEDQLLRQKIMLFVAKATSKP